MSKTKAKELVNKFSGKTGKGVFTNISRNDVAKSLLERIDNPGKINQGKSSLCAPAALLYNIALTNPVNYATFAIDLFEKGMATIGKLSIEPGSDLKTYNLPKSNVDPADWITLASIRDSQNWFFDYQAEPDEVAGITLPGSLEGWFKKAGYTKVVNATNLFFNKDEANARKANDLYKKGFKISLFINANMLYTSKQDDSSVTPDHWVVLTKNMTITAKSVNFAVYTWGNSKRSVPQSGTLSLENFLDNYYGFVGCKY